MVFSVSFFAAVFVNSGSEKTSSYKEAAESKYSLGNFVDLSDYEAERSDNELYSNGFLSGYYTVDNYSKSDGSYNYYTATVYEYTGGTAASRKLIKKRLERPRSAEKALNIQTEPRAITDINTVITQTNLKCGLRHISVS